MTIATTTEIHRFDTAGRHIGTIGRRGGGPGEFAYLSGFAECASGQVVASDAMHRRLTVLVPPPGKPVTLSFADVGAASSLVPIACQGDVVYLLMSQERPVPLPRRTLYRDTLIVLRSDLTFAKRDTMLRIPGGATFDGLTQPFGAVGQVAINERFLVSGTTSDSTLSIRPRTGGAVRKAVVRGLPIVVLSSQLFARRVAEAEKETPKSIWARELKDLYATVPRPRQLPLWDRLLIDDVSRVWVREYRSPLVPQDSSSRWHVVSRTGAALGVLEVRGGNELVAVRGSSALLTERDTDDVETLHLRKIRGL